MQIIWEWIHINTNKDFDNDTLTLYSGGGYIAKSRLMSSYSKRRKPLRITNKRQTAYHRKLPHRFNEELDNVSQRSVNQKRALSRGIAVRPRESLQPNFQTLNPPEEENQRVKKQIINKIDKMTEEEIDRISRKIDEITQGDEDHKVEEHQIAENEAEKEDVDAHQELQDQVDSLPEQPNDYKSATELSEARSRGSQRSSKSYVLKLRQELQNEREQRERLEHEIEELKKISSEISSKLGIKH